MIAATFSAGTRTTGRLTTNPDGMSNYMARKVVNRKALREANDAAEALGKAEGKPETKKKAPAKRKSKAKDPEAIRMKLFWGVFNQTMKRVALYEFNQKKQAEQKADELNAAGKQPHFVMKVKEEVVEKAEK